MTRTYSRARFLEARRAWADGEFGPEWRWVYRIAVQRGFIFPPNGTRHDNRDAAEPSQRAVIYAAMEENPTELRRILEASSSWSQVIDRIFGMERTLVDDANLRDKDIAWDNAQERPTRRDALLSVGAILGQIAASVGVDRKDAA